MTPLKPIRTESDHAAALIEIAALMDAQAGTPEADRLELLGVLVANHERGDFDQAPTAVDVLETAMRTQGRTQAELAAVLGSRARASEVLARRRGLSAEMAAKLSAAWSIPARLLGSPSKSAADPATRRSAKTSATAVGAALALALAGSLGAMLYRLPSTSPAVALAAPGPGRVAVADLPPHVFQAFLSAEDHGFFRHAGYQPGAVLRATSNNLSPAHWGRRPEGGSTLTQQVVKTVLLKGEARSLRRKVRELVLARRLEARLGKAQIFALWLNNVYFGEGATGLTAAAGHYFGKAPADLTVDEAAWLAGLPSAPTRLAADPGRAAERRDWILARMRQEGFVAPEASASRIY